MNPCAAHPFEYAVDSCACCGGSFCDSCLGELMGARYCGRCRIHHLALVERLRASGGRLEPPGAPVRHSVWGMVSLGLFGSTMLAVGGWLRLAFGRR
jgi:hypothetical protein